MLECTSKEGLIYRAEFVTKKEKAGIIHRIEIYGTPYKSWLRDLPVLPDIPLLSNEIVNDKIRWKEKDDWWVPEEIRQYCDKLVKNRMFL